MSLNIHALVVPSASLVLRPSALLVLTERWKEPSIRLMDVQPVPPDTTASQEHLTSISLLVPEELTALLDKA